MRDTLDILIQHYGMRLTIANLAHCLNTTPTNIRKEISTETFPIPTYKEKPSQQAPRFADARDVAEYLDAVRQKAGPRASQGRGGYNA